MAVNSKIEWCEATWNPITGCTRVSEGCTNCYAVTMTRRLAAMGQEKYQGLINDGKDHFNGVVKAHPSTLDIPLRRKKPTMYFVNSMSDLFHKDVPKEFIFKVFAVMEAAHQHTFQILTKRPERMPALLEEMGQAVANLDIRHPFMQRVQQASRFLGHPVWQNAPLTVEWPLPNVWLGTSVENQAEADRRIPHLLKTPAAVRWLSCEPLLGPIDMTPFNVRNYRAAYAMEHGIVTAGMELRGEWYERAAFIDWVVAGAESGTGARPMDEDWVRRLRDFCRQTGTPFFYKQNAHKGKKLSTPMLDGVQWMQYPTPVPA